MGLPAVLIPSYCPKPALLDVVAEIASAGLFQRILVVDDGSPATFADVFDRLLRHEEVRILRHPSNLGKGAALKTGFRELLRKNTAETADWPTHVICADGDSQHAPQDVLRVARASLANPECVVLGSRSFGRQTPIRNRFGNAVTAYLFHILTGRKIKDTQTGLRAIPLPLLSTLAGISSCRYDYEIKQLLAILALEIRVLELEITTIYAPDRDRHFRALRDSASIYRALFSFSSKSWALNYPSDETGFDSTSIGP